MAGEEKNSFMPLEDVKKFIKQFPNFEIVRYSGGEPFNHKEIIPILKYTKKQNKIVEILSCGIKGYKEIPEKIMNKISPYVDKIIFSMHGYDDTHDEIVTSDKQLIRHPPYWDFMIDSFDHARWAGINTSFETVLMKDNYNKLEEIARSVSLCNKIAREDWDSKKPFEEVTWHILRFVKQGRGKINPYENLNKKEIENFPKKVEELKEKYNLKITYTNSFEKNKCDCGSEKAVVTYNGKIISCSALKYMKKTDKKFACKNRI